MRFIYRALPWSTDYSRYESKVLHWSGCVPIMAVLLCLIPFCGCGSVELGSAPAWVVEDAGEAPPAACKNVLCACDVPKGRGCKCVNCDDVPGCNIFPNAAAPDSHLDEPATLRDFKRVEKQLESTAEFFEEVFRGHEKRMRVLEGVTIDDDITPQPKGARPDDFKSCTCSDHRAELQALQFRVAGIEQRESLRPFRETPKSQPSVPVYTQPAQRYEGDCANGQCGPRRLAPRIFGRFR